MNDKQFIKDAIRTESPNFFQPNTRILHAAIGCVTESGELLDALKKQMYYGRELDLTNVKEEAGDLLWYLAILFDELETDFETECNRVINKLKARFPDKFTEGNAFNRDLDTERKVLEQGE
jgi:NTP pyrophosphatase (non-canonical NTP hydrolase)